MRCDRRSGGGWDNRPFYWGPDSCLQYDIGENRWGAPPKEANDSSDTKRTHSSLFHQYVQLWTMGLDYPLLIFNHHNLCSLGHDPVDTVPLGRIGMYCNQRPPP
jgi:hypothetical protein